LNNHTPPQPDDTTIAVLILDRDEAGLRALLEVHGPRVKGWLNQRFAELLGPDEIDAVLNVAAFNAWRRIVQFDDARGSLGGWFLRIAHNAAVDCLRQPGQQRLDTVEDPTEYADPWSEAEDFSDDPELQRLTEAVNDIIDKELPPRQREVMLADLAADGHADSERLAARLGITVAAVHTARSKAHKRIREELAKRGLAPARKE